MQSFSLLNMRYSSTNYLIKLCIYPLLEEECRRLKIPKNFILGIYVFYCKDGIVGYVEEIRERNKVIGVRIKIGDCIESSRELLKVFFHEMFHVKEIYEGKKKLFSEFLADLYAEKRFLQLMLTKWKYKNCFSI